jgi:NADH:ubiquinone oxidoreductase subunit 6 (subunit J)
MILIDIEVESLRGNFVGVPCIIFSVLIFYSTPLYPEIFSLFFMAVTIFLLSVDFVGCFEVANCWGDVLVAFVVTRGLRLGWFCEELFSCRGYVASGTGAVGFLV